MEDWAILGAAAKDDDVLNDYMVSVMESSFYFEEFEFGNTLKDLAGSFFIDAWYADADDDSGFCPVREDECIVEITAVFGEDKYCLGFVFGADDDYGVFRMCYAHDGEHWFQDADAVMDELEPYFTQVALNRMADSVMTSSYYFPSHPFGETLRRQAQAFSLNAFLAEEDSPEGMYPVAEGDGIVTIEAFMAGHTYYMEFVFDRGDESGAFYLCYGEADNEPVEDFGDYILLLAPFFT